MSNIPPYGYGQEQQPLYPPQQPENPSPYPGPQASYPPYPGYPEPPQPTYPPPPLAPMSYSQPLNPTTAPGYQPQIMPPQQPYMPYMAQPMMIGVPVPVADPGAGAATTSLVLGIIGLVFAVIGVIPYLFVCGGLGFILGIIGIPFGAIGRRSVQRHGQALAGLIMSIIAVTIPIAALVFFAVILGAAAVSAPSHP